jgi:predicted GNAT family N-acyltransferase
MERVVHALNALRMNDPDRLGDWFARFATLYRAAGEVAPAESMPSRIELEWDFGRGATLVRHPYSRAVWRRAHKGARCSSAAWASRCLHAMRSDWPPHADRRCALHGVVTGRTRCGFCVDGSRPLPDAHGRGRMRDTNQPFRVEAVIDYLLALPELRAVRETVFVEEQKVPIEDEWDALDPECVHVIARALDGRAIGTGRLTPEHKIGRMAVLPEWRGKGVGDAMLLALVEEAQERGWREVALNAQVSAIDFYVRHGFRPEGERFWEAGIEHQAMRRELTGPKAIDDRDTAIATVVSLLDASRRGLWCIRATWIRACSTRPAWSMPSAASPPPAAATRSA